MTVPPGRQIPRHPAKFYDWPRNRSVKDLFGSVTRSLVSNQNPDIAIPISYQRILTQAITAVVVSTVASHGLTRVQAQPGGLTRVRG